MSLESGRNFGVSLISFASDSESQYTITHNMTGIFQSHEGSYYFK